MTTFKRSLLLAASATALAACGDDPAGEGEVRVTVYGESFIEDGIPADEMGDGWAVTFDRFVVTVGDVVVGGVTFPDPDAIDISVGTEGAGHEIGVQPVRAGAHTAPSFEIARVELAGSATLGGDTKTFDWTIDAPTHYHECETTTQVGDGETATFQITVHADHFFYDSLVADEPAVVFQALADADADGDGAITQAELEATGLGAYDAGSEGDVDNLWDWLVAQSRTLGHVDGEGHCDAHAHSD